MPSSSNFVATLPTAGFLLVSVALRLPLLEAAPPASQLVARLCAAAVVLLAVLCLSRLLTSRDFGPGRSLFSEQLAKRSRRR
jgi:hypothetical protein